MKRRICSVRCDNCASISGTVSGIGSGINPGSIPAEEATAEAAEESLPCVLGILPAGEASLGELCALCGCLTGVAAVVVTGAIGSVEYAGNVKSKWCSGEVVLNF